jgi:hypothetical protein
MNLVPRPFELRADKPANERNARRVSILIDDIERSSLDATTRYPRANTPSFRVLFYTTRRRARLRKRQNQPERARSFGGTSSLARARSSASLTRHANPERRRRRRRIDHRDDMITPTTTMTTGNRRAQSQHDGTKRKGRTCTSNSLSSNLSRFVCNASRSSAPSVLYLAQTSRDGGVPSGA